ncbi:MAG: hypothetical protein RLZZ196_2493, partial [Bacteroidota bacterium]
TKALNSRLFFTGNNAAYKYGNDTGSEFIMTYDKSDSKHKLFYAARSKSEQIGFDPANMFLGNPARYTYNLDANGAATIARTEATITHIQNEDFCIGKEIFTHGSGMITLTDASSKYTYEFTATALNVLAPNNAIPIADFPYANGSKLYIASDNPASTIYRYSVTTINNDGTNITSITVTPDKASYPNIANGEVCAVYMSDPVNLQGFCCGLIRASDINSTDILDDIKYGVMILPSNNTMGYRGGDAYVKNYDDWYNSDKLYEGDNESICFILGRLEDVPNMGSGNMNDYKMRIASTDTSTGTLTAISTTFLTADYIDDNYIFVYATMRQNGSFNNITYTKSKLVNSKLENGKYYINLNPEINEIRPIDISNIKYSNGSFGWTPNNVYSYLKINLLNQTTADMLGYATDDQYTMYEQVNDKPDMICTFISRYSVNPNWSLPSDFNISIPNLDIESYLNGSKSTVIYSLGHQIINSRYFSFTPPEMLFLSLKNVSPISLNSLTIRMEDDEGNLTVEQANSSVTLCIRTYIK